jgi:hypothetical protein
MNTGSAKMDLATKSVSAAYRSENADQPEGETESVIKDATSSTIGETKKALSTFDAPADGGDSVAKKEMMIQLNKEIEA